MYEHVTNDLRLAQDVLTEDGVICLDDIFSPLWPEVAIATFDLIRADDSRFVPILATRDKLYLCDSKYAPLYRGIINDDKELSSQVFRRITILSHDVIVLLPCVRSRIVDRFGSLLSTARL